MLRNRKKMNHTRVGKGLTFLRIRETNDEISDSGEGALREDQRCVLCCSSGDETVVLG